MSCDFRAWQFADGSWKTVSSVPIGDRGFRYGASVFETVYIHRSKPVFWMEHLRRLADASAALFGFSVEADWSGLLDHLTGFLNGQCGVLRLVATEGEGGVLDLPAKAALYAYAESVTGEPYRPAAVDVVIFEEPFSPALHGHKTGSYLFHLRARRHAVATGVAEAMLRTAEGLLVSASMANMFVVTEAALLTPPGSMGARDGVVKSWVRDRYNVHEGQVTEELALNARGVFLTNSRIGIQEVRSIDGFQIARWSGVGELQKAYVGLLEGGEF